MRLTKSGVCCFVTGLIAGSWMNWKGASYGACAASIVMMLSTFLRIVYFVTASGMFPKYIPIFGIIDWAFWGLEPLWVPWVVLSESEHEIEKVGAQMPHYLKGNYLVNSHNHLFCRVTSRIYRIYIYKGGKEAIKRKSGH